MGKRNRDDQFKLDFGSGSPGSSMAHCEYLTDYNLTFIPILQIKIKNMKLKKKKKNYT